MSNLEKYAPLAISAVALVLSLRNKRDIKAVQNHANHIADAVNKSFRDIESDVGSLFDFKKTCYDNFGIIQTDLNKIATHVGYQGKLGVNE